MAPEEIIHFWFEEIDSKKWFEKSEKFDSEIRSRFKAVYELALKGDTRSWRSTAQGRLAEILVLDQFSRNMFRGTARAFEGDPLALKLAQEAVELKLDQDLPVYQRAFLYMPFMHSEDLAMHEKALKLFQQKGLESNLKFEILHQKIIERFGRFPHRNAILGRPSTPEEIEFLKTPGSSF